MSRRTGYTRSPLLQTGTLIQLNNDIVGFVPYITVFQYNPETISRTFDIDTFAYEEHQAIAKLSNPTGRAYVPSETYSFKLELDATDDLEISRPLTLVNGVADRLAALERMIFPSQGLIGDLANLIGEPSRASVPIVLLCLGARAMPVWVASLSITETAHNPALMPIHAEVDLAFRVLTMQELLPTNLASVPKPDVLIALAVLRIYETQRKFLALANAESVMTDQIHHLGLI